MLNIICYQMMSSLLQVLLEVEVDQNLSNESGSVMDNVAVGIISACRASSS